MPNFKTNREVLDRKDPLELVLELLSFAGGENTIGEDQELKKNEARVIKNWDAISLGGMKRSKGFTEVATMVDDGQLDLLIEHVETGTSTRLYGVVDGDVVYDNAGTLTVIDAAAFTADLLCHAVSAGDKIWITNSTDNLKYNTIAGNITVPADQPAVAKDRIYNFKSRLIAEGGNDIIYGSRAASGNWTAADAWTLVNDAWNITMPNYTKGMVMDWPTGDMTVFTEYGAFVISNQPAVAYRPIPGSHGCSAPLSIAKGNEGVFFVSRFPTLGVYLWNGVNWVNLTEFHDFVDDIDFDNRIFGVYRNNNYYLFYNEVGSGVTYPNRLRIYNTRFGRWMERPVVDALADNFGYPTILKYSDNELYVASSRESNVYELEDASTSDGGNNTEADYKTKSFSSADFSIGRGGKFPIDDVRMKMIKMTLTFYGLAGAVTIQWTADRGNVSGSQTFDAAAEGDLINTTFVVNTSLVVASVPDKTVTKSFKNSAVGRRFDFQILNIDTGVRPEVKKLKIHAIAMEEA